MSKKYTVRSHEVTASKIAKLLPLYDGTGFASPTRGVNLELEGGRTVRWLIEDKSHVPQVGDFIVDDSALDICILVPSAKFPEVFEVSEE